MSSCDGGVKTTQLTFQLRDGSSNLPPSLQLLETEIISTPLFIIDTKKIYVEKVSAGMIAKLQPKMSKAIWRPAPGRKLGFIVWHENDMLGVAFLASPVINMGARDLFLNLPKDPSLKGKELRHYADLSVCVSTQPIGWHWNVGKLIALLATTFGDYWLDQYKDELKGIVTTSLWGKGTQYNRVYKFLGYTKGYGHEHINDENYHKMLEWMRQNKIDIPSCKFGAGSNPRMRRIAAYKKASGDKSVNLKHEKIRGIYYHPSVDPNTRQQIIEDWYKRWGFNRYQKTMEINPPYLTGLT